MLRVLGEFVREVNDAAQNDRTGTVGLIVAIALVAMASCGAAMCGVLPN